MAPEKDTGGRQKLKQTQKLTAHQVQLMNMVMMPVTDLSQRIKREIEENPALEEGKDYGEEDGAEELYGASGDDGAGDLSEKDMVLGDYSDPDEIPDTTLKQYGRGRINPGDIPFSEEPSLQDYLLSQLGLTTLDEGEQETAKFLIGSLDDDGYLRRPLTGLLDDLAIYRGVYLTEEELSKILGVLKTLDPPGVFARDLRECLLLQLDRRPGTETTFLAKRLLSDRYFEAFTMRHYAKLAQSLKVSDEELRAAVSVVTGLNPSPGLDYGNKLVETLQVVIPDFEVHEVDGELQVTLYRGDIPEVRLNRDFRDNMSEYLEAGKKRTPEQKETGRFVKSKIYQAKNFVQMLKLRENALMSTMMTIVDLQREYFLTGELQNLKPMILKDIADRTGFDISTISRVTSSKYVATDFGTFPLKHFFTDGTLTRDGEEVSTHHVRELITEIVDGEDKQKPLSDETIKSELKRRGFDVARRTIAKYRDQLGIPVARMRKEV
ncbi:MAG: RNA polymerase factor sigma-54 [Porphyromonas sp.]|nr:RNA polymerase factor sigma-54 [Bacteroidales bacterium]MDY3100089.1 RNA polymerase factor sigma-54 [Porphyromonas sp.]